MKHRTPLGHFAFTIVCSGQAIFFKADGAKAVNAHHRRLSGDSAAGALLAPLLVVVAMIAENASERKMDTFGMPMSSLSGILLPLTSLRTDPPTVMALVGGVENANKRKRGKKVLNCMLALEIGE